MGRLGENDSAPSSANEQTRSTLHPQQQGEAFPPYQENNHHQPAAFPPPPEKAHAFPPPQADQQATPSSFPQNQPMPGMAMPAYQGGPNGGSMHGGMGTMPGVSPYTNPAFQAMPHAPGQLNVIMPPMINTEPWKTSLFDCFDDPENALITSCFPCVTFGQIAEIVDQGSSSCGTSGFMYTMISFCIAMPCLLSCGYRSKLRNLFRLVESPGPDWIIHCFCEWCALCQEYRELKLRGYDPAIGWMGNAARQVNAIAMTPPMQPIMMGR